MKRTLFRAYMYYVYCSPLWLDATVAAKHEIKVAYNDIFRAFFRLPSMCSVSENMAIRRINTFSAIIRNNAAGLLRRMHASDNKFCRCFVQDFVTNKRFCDSVHSLTRTH